MAYEVKLINKLQSNQNERKKNEKLFSEHVMSFLNI